MPIGSIREATAIDERDRSSSCSSSIGRNSDRSHGSVGSDGDESEVQSELKGPLDTMDALEDSLPIKHGISKFYCGKSKSFTSLVDASSSAAKDLAKPMNSCTRKRKNLLALTRDLDSDFSDPMSTARDNLCKRLMTTNRSMPILVRTSSSSDSNSNSSSEEELKHSPLLPPRHPCVKTSLKFAMVRPQNCTLSMRSFSLADLQDATNSAPTTTWR